MTASGHGKAAVTSDDILGPSEAVRKAMDYYAHAPGTRAALEKLAREKPTTLACMHGSAWKGDGGALLRELADALTADASAPSQGPALRRDDLSKSAFAFA